MIPLKFQLNAIQNLEEKFVNLWSSEGRQLPLVFKSPTGSGKTFVIANLVRQLNNMPNWDQDKAFVWITFSDDIAMQSKKKFEEYFENNSQNILLTVDDINRGKLNKNDILFLNWQKVVSKSAENRILRRPLNEEERKETGVYFEDLIDNTHNDQRELILVIDEAHTHVTKDLAQEIIDYIDPKIILHITATPSVEVELKSRRVNGFVEVDRRLVIEEGLIKDKILVQTEEDLKKHKALDLDETLLSLGLEKRMEIAEEYKALGKKVNPLMLIQLPNDDRKLVDLGEKTKEQIVLEYLARRGVNKSQIALWFDGKQENMEFITDNDSKVDFLLFKQAAGTGWDCPRAHVLVMFREINSDTFYIQTVGRILRMPEPDKKEDYLNSTALRTAFLFTNYERNKVNAKWNELLPNKEEIFIAKRKKSVSNLQLRSDYVSRLEYGDLSSSAKFQASFVKSMNNYFNISSSEVLEGVAKRKLAKRGIDFNVTLTNKVIVDAAFEDFDQLGYDFKNQGHDLTVEMSKNDVEKTFNYYCYKILKEQTEENAKISNVARSWSPLKSSIRVWLKGLVSDDSDQYYRIFINDITKGASSVFRPAITQSIKDYQPILQKVIAERRKILEQKEAPTFSIKSEYWYTDDYEEVNSNLCVLEKCYFLKDYIGKKNEASFREYIESKSASIEWWFKNFDYGREYYAIKYWNHIESAFRLFYPDWIIKFRDGKIGIFDTKAGDTASPEKTKDKAEALSAKLKALGKNFVGGIVVFENGVWYYNDTDNYCYNKGKLSGWKKLEELFTLYK